MWKTIYTRNIGNSSGFWRYELELQKDDNLYRGANKSFVEGIIRVQPFFLLVYFLLRHSLFNAPCLFHHSSCIQRGNILRREGAQKW